jgi:hypothetical protein
MFLNANNIPVLAIDIPQCPRGFPCKINAIKGECFLAITQTCEGLLRLGYIRRYIYNHYHSRESLVVGWHGQLFSE